MYCIINYFYKKYIICVVFLLVASCNDSDFGGRNSSASSNAQAVLNQDSGSDQGEQDEENVFSDTFIPPTISIELTEENLVDTDDKNTQNTQNPKNTRNNRNTQNRQNPTKNTNSGTAPSITSQQKKRYKFTFDIPQSEISSRIPVDLVWIIDNSASMVDDIAFIRENLASFMDKAKNVSSLKVAVVSCLKSNLLKTPKNYCTDFPDSLAQKIHEHNQFVDSHNSPAVLHKVIVNEELSTFFRDKGKSEKIIIDVSDEYARFPNPYPQHLKSSIERYFGKQHFIYHSISTDAPKTCGETYSSFYGEFAAEYNGELLKICPENWNKYFSDLLVNVVQKTSVDITLSGLENKNFSIVSIHVGDTQYTSSQYDLRLSNNHAPVLSLFLPEAYTGSRTMTMVIEIKK